MYAPAAPAAPAAPPQQDFTYQLCNPCKHEISAYGACIWRERLRDCQSRSWCRSEIGAPWQPALAPGRSWAVCTALVQCRLQACCSDLCGLCALVGKEWTTVGPDSEIKLVGVSAAASTVIVAVYVYVSVRGDRAQGRTYPHPGSIFFRNSHFSESLLPLKRHRGEPTHTHGTHGRTRAHESHRTQKNLSPHKTTTQEPSKLTNTPARPHDRTTARRPNPRPIQQPQPRSRTLPTADYRSVRSRLPRSLFTGTVPVLSRVCPPGSPRCLYRAWLLSRPRFRPSRGRAGVSLGLDGCEVDRLCDPCARMCARVSRVCPVCVPAPTGVFLPVRTDHR